MMMKEETKNLLFIGGIFLYLVVVTGILVRDYRQEKRAEKARIAEIQGWAGYEQAKWERDNYLKLMPLLAEYEAHKEVRKQERENELAEMSRVIILKVK